jgi:hypothetical protein
MIDEDIRDSFSLLTYYKPHNTKYDKEQSPYYDIDVNDKLTITPKHYDHIIKRITETNLFNKVKEEVKTIQFLFPQVKHNYEVTFCNEDVYGNANFLTVHGFMRLE